jgi:antitoxin YefM
MQAMTLNEAAQDLLNVMNKVNTNHEPLVVTYEPQKSVVIMSLDDFNAWQKTAFLSHSSTRDLRKKAGKIGTSAVQRKPSAKIASQGKILGDIMTPIVATEDWSALA